MILRRSNPLPMKCKPWITEPLPLLITQRVFHVKHFVSGDCFALTPNPPVSSQIREHGLRGVDHDSFMILRRSNPLPMKCRAWITEPLPLLLTQQVFPVTHFVVWGLLRAHAQPTVSSQIRVHGLRGVDHDSFMILRRSNPLPMKCKAWITEPLPLLL